MFVNGVYTLYTELSNVIQKSGAQSIYSPFNSVQYKHLTSAFETRQRPLKNYIPFSTACILCRMGSHNTH